MNPLERVVARATRNKPALFIRRKYLEWFLDTIDFKRLGDEFDSLYGTDTGGMDFFREEDGQVSQHLAASLQVARRALACLEIDAREHVFIDFGCAKGRVLLVASELPFRKVIGVEIHRGLVETARKNATVYASPTQRCADIEVHCQDATTYVPSERDHVVAFFNDPFPGPIFRRVIENLAGLVRAGREVTVLHCAGAFGFDGWPDCIPILEEFGRSACTRLLGYRPELLGYDIKSRAALRREKSSLATFMRKQFSPALEDALKPLSSAPDNLVAYGLNTILRDPTLYARARSAGALTEGTRIARFGPRITHPEDQLSLNRMMLQAAFLPACELFSCIPITVYRLGAR